MSEPSMRSSPRGGYKRMGLNVYPHPFFDPSSWYLPPTVKELYRWCAYIFLTNATVGPIVRKKASYVITDLIYETKNADYKALWKDLLEKTMRIREFEIMMLLDYEVFGNAFCSIVYPFERYLVCKFCNYENLLKNIKWEYNGESFVGRCKNCKSHASMGVKDKPIRNRTRIKLMRWFPQYIDVRHNPLTGNTKYILRIPKWLKTRIRDTKINKVYVEDTPLDFLIAIRTDRNIEFSSDNIFHLKHETISLEDSSLGLPPILNVFKDVWLHQTYKKGQEAIALDHILPMTLLSPMPAPGTAAPHMNIDLMGWQTKIHSIIEKWRRDQNGMFTMPFPVNVNQVRGDAQALSLHNDLNQTRQNIAGGCDVPADFLFGSLNWSGGNISLRVLENLLIGRLARMDAFLEEWVCPRMRRYFRLPFVNIHHADFKMADDVQQKQIAMNLRQTNTISDQTVIEELGFDKAKEDKRKAEETEQRIKAMEKDQIAQAEIQAKVQIIQTKAQMEIQQMMAAGQPQMPPEQAPAGQGQQGQGQEPPRVLPSPDQTTVTLSSQGQLSPASIAIMAENVVKTTPPEHLEFKINSLKETEPMLARAVEARIKTIQKGVADIDPLPEQKPPRRSPEKAVI